MTDKHVLIVGFGSAGRRHATNMFDLGCKISCIDTREDRRNRSMDGVEVVGRYSDLGAALNAANFDGAVVATPTVFHVDQSIALLRAGIPILLEKPMAMDLTSSLNLEEVRKETRVPALLGYTWRWWPPLRMAREALEGRRVGRILRVDFWMSANLLDWHPWEPLEDFFMSEKALGGGALLDESHWIDLMIWFFGIPDTVYGRVEKISDLPIDADDNVDLIAAYDNGPRVSVHLDLIGRPHEKTIRFVGSDGTLLWSADPNSIRISTDMEQTWEIAKFDCQRNDMFVSLATEFVAVIDGAIPTCRLSDGLETMRVIEAVRRSNDQRRAVPMNEV